MIHNAIRSQKDSVLKAPHLTVRPDENRNVEMRKARIAAEENPASIFNRSALKDYQGKKLSPLQESIMKLQEQMHELKENEEMKPEQKDELLKTMTKQLEQLEKQLAEENAKKQEENSAGSVKKKDEEGVLGKEQSKEEKEAQSLIAAGAGLQRVKSLQTEAETNKGKAKAAQWELDYAVSKPEVMIRISLLRGKEKSTSWKKRQQVCKRKWAKSDKMIGKKQKKMTMSRIIKINMSSGLTSAAFVSVNLLDEGEMAKS